MESNDGPVYVYGVLRSMERPAITEQGVDASTVGAVEHVGLAALKSPASAAMVAGPRDVRAHWRVLDQALQHATVIPLRFGTVMESDEVVRDRLLRPNSERLNALLEQFAGLVQVGVTGRYDERLLLTQIVRGSPAIAALREQLRGAPDGKGSHAQRIKLGELVAAEVRRRGEDDAQTALATLEPAAVAATQELAPAGAPFKLAFLVDRDRPERFDRAVANLRRRLGGRIAIRYVGPLPPYSFADVDLVSGDPAWA